MYPLLDFLPENIILKIHYFYQDLSLIWSITFSQISFLLIAKLIAYFYLNLWFKILIQKKQVKQIKIGYALKLVYLEYTGSFVQS